MLLFLFQDKDLSKSKEETTSVKPDNSETFKDLHNYIEKISSYKAASDDELNWFLFGRKMDPECDSIFERILKTKGMSELVQLIWKKFDLSSKLEILKLVRLVKVFLRSSLLNYFFIEKLL